MDDLLEVSSLAAGAYLEGLEFGEEVVYKSAKDALGLLPRLDKGV